MIWGHEIGGSSPSIQTTPVVGTNPALVRRVAGFDSLVRLHACVAQSAEREPEKLDAVVRFHVQALTDRLTGKSAGLEPARSGFESSSVNRDV